MFKLAFHFLAALVLCCGVAQAQNINGNVIPPGAGNNSLLPLNNTWFGNQTWLGTTNLDQMSITSVPCASGSALTTSGTISAGSNILQLSTPIDFVNCEGIQVYGAGPPMAVAAPVISSLVQQGTTGSTTYKFYIASFDYAGGISAPRNVTITNGNATLNFTNNLTLTTGALPNGAAGYIVWVSINNGPATYATASNTTTLVWTGFYQNWRPNWVPALAPTSASPDWLVTTIQSGASVNWGSTGTTILTLNAPAGTSVTGAFVQHNEDAALNAIDNLYPNGVQARLGCGTYNITQTITIGPSARYIALRGDGMCTQIQPFGASTYFQVQGTSNVAFIDGIAVSDMYIPAYNSLGGKAIFSQYVTREFITNMIIDHPFSGVEINDGNDFHWEHLRIYSRWGYGGTDWKIGSGPASADYVCCGFIIDTYSNDLNSVQGGANSASIGQMRAAGACWYIDGDVQTIFMYGDAVSSCEGKSWFIGNGIGNPQNPQFIQANYSGMEFGADRGIDIEAGQIMYFTESNIHAAQNNNNNVVIASGTSFIHFEGGFNDSAAANCFDIAGANVSISGMVIYDCGLAATQTFHSIVLDPTASSVAITGNNFQGQWGGVSWQTSHPIYINSGASAFACGGNTFASFQFNYEQNNAGYSPSQNCDGNAGRPPASIASGFGTSPSIVAGDMLAFSLNVGTGGTASTGVITMPIATNGWNCSVTDANQSQSNTKSFQTTTSSITIVNYNYANPPVQTAWGSGDILRFICHY